MKVLLDLRSSTFLITNFRSSPRSFAIMHQMFPHSSSHPKAFRCSSKFRHSRLLASGIVRREMPLPQNASPRPPRRRLGTSSRMHKMSFSSLYPILPQIILVLAWQIYSTPVKSRHKKGALACYSLAHLPFIQITICIRRSLHCLTRSLAQSAVQLS